MPGNITEKENTTGLSQQEVVRLRQQYGKNVLRAGNRFRFLRIVWGIFSEPMFILLVIACTLYFILGNTSEGILMAVAMAIVTAISLYQEVKSSRALESLRQFTEPRVVVLRDGKEITISNEDLVPGDIMLLEEGMKIPADAIVLQSNDLSINESIITGESVPADKNETEGNNSLYQGTTINSGKCKARVTATGNDTQLGKIGKAISGYHPPKTLLQVQINSFVRKLAFFGLAGFVIILLVNYFHYRDFATSLLFALTLAMSAIPEEVPVAFSSFMALGAYKMSRLGIISRQPQIIENLGAINVLCLDKTGTITENSMEVKTIYDYESDRIIEMSDTKPLNNDAILFYAALASETEPFDAMEKAILAISREYKLDKALSEARMIHEYPLEGKPPMMTHVYEAGDKILVAAKGGAERVIRACRLDEAAARKVTQHVQALAAKGYRVLGVARATQEHREWPAGQDDFNWHFLGLVALYDPPRKNVAQALKQIKAAHIEIKLLTGDFPQTAVNIAGQVDLADQLDYMTGEEVMHMPQETLQQKVKTIHVFARMFPEAKVKVIQTMKANGDIVAMTGDGVNDGPALKIADIGIAMGKKGTETARQASDLVLTDDNLEKIVSSVSEGRKIFSNLVKAVRYIIAIHIPIVLTASLPLLLGWKFPNIFTPIHVIFLELVMGPTCSIFFEREPAESDLMRQAPRKREQGLFSRQELATGILQGLAITLGILVLYYIYMSTGHSIGETRTVVFTTLILGNVFLTFASRSFTQTIFYTSRYKNSLAPVILVVSVIFLLLLHFLPFARSLFKLEAIAPADFLLCLAVAFAGVMWFEVYKWIKGSSANTSAEG